MAIPPTLKAVRDASPGAAMLERLRKGTDNERICQWPGTEDKESRFRLVPLTCAELQDAYAAAVKRWTELELKVDLYTADDFNSEVHVQIIARSMRTMDDRLLTLFVSGEELRDKITADERHEIVTEYLALVQESDPDPAAMSPEVIEQIDELVKKKDAATLSGFSSLILSSYIVGMASQSSSSPTGKPGSSPSSARAPEKSKRRARRPRDEKAAPPDAAA
jgi:hypothetical protein